MHSIDSIVKVLTEISVLDHLLQILVRRTDKPYINRDSFSTTYTHDASVLDCPEQLRLQVKRNVSDLIKEKSSSVCLLELTDVVCMSIRERSFHMAEQFALEKSLGQGSGIYADHRLQSPVRPSVNLASQHILTGSVLTSYQH